MSTTFTLHTHLIDWQHRKTYPAEVVVVGGTIQSISETAAAVSGYLLPGFVDAHVHIESSMVRPSAFGRWAVQHGTLGTVSDPHEIANVLGKKGVLYMLEDAESSPIYHAWGVPSCVPATSMETAGAAITPVEVEELFRDHGLPYLAEMMNYPGVLFQDPEVMEKLAIAQRYGKPIDGHAPGLMGADANTYFGHGISTDHECYMLEEALGKAALGVKILIREGSAARNFEALHPVLRQYPELVMFCSDDKHPDDLLLGHINLLAARALALGYDLYDVLKAACVNPVQHYGLPLGLLRVGDAADMVLVENLDTLTPSKVWRAGQLIWQKGDVPAPPPEAKTLPNQWQQRTVTASDFMMEAPSGSGAVSVHVIEAEAGQLITKASTHSCTVQDGHIMADLAADVLHVTVINRYDASAPPSHSFIRGFGLKQGALASSVAHDSHNLIVVGTDPESMAMAAQAVLDAHGGLSVAVYGEAHTLPLPIAGLMSDKPVDEVAAAYSLLNAKAQEAGTTLPAPFMTLSFMALLVIPELKLSDKGLFTAVKWQLIDPVAGS